MTTIDLGTPPPPPVDLLDALPRRVTLTLPELHLVAEHAGGAPLPFAMVQTGETSAIEDRLGASRASTEDQAYLAAVTTLHDPVTSLGRRGLLVDDTMDNALIGAVGLLATPEVAVDLDVAVDDVQAKAWHRQSGDAVAALSTTDGIVFELAWFPVAAWPAELARVGVLPEDRAARESQVPDTVELPYELADAGAESVRTGRADLTSVLATQHAGAVLDGSGRPLGEAEAAQVVQALVAESTGRLRVLVAAVTPESTSVVGVRSWVLVGNGWRSLHPHRVGESVRVRLQRVEASDLAADLAPVLSEAVA